jgi:hypothetical protein
MVHMAELRPVIMHARTSIYGDHTLTRSLCTQCQADPLVETDSPW